MSREHVKRSEDKILVELVSHFHCRLRAVERVWLVGYGGIVASSGL